MAKITTHNCLMIFTHSSQKSEIKQRKPYREAYSNPIFILYFQEKLSLISLPTRFTP